MKKIIFITIFLSLFVQAKETTKSLYSRLGGYDAITAVSKDFHIRLKADPQLGRFWAYRGTDGLDRELQLLIDYVCAKTGGPTFYTGRDMPTTHIGMKISQSDWKIFMTLFKDTLKKFKVAKQEKDEVIEFIESLKTSMVEL